MNWHVALYIPPVGAGIIGEWGQGGWQPATHIKANVKAIHDAGWAPGLCDVFATWARDKKVKLWTVTEDMLMRE